jgi:hypothetical protein
VLHRGITDRGCQMVYFQIKNLSLGKFLRALDWKMLIYFMSICNILQTFGIFYDHLVHFKSIWHIFIRFWYHVPRKNLATLSRTLASQQK